MSGNPTAVIDPYVPLSAFQTTFADYITDKQDKAGLESTPAQSQSKANAAWGDWTDDAVLAFIAEGIPKRYSNATADATPADLTVAGPVRTDGVMWVKARIWGKVAAQDFVYVEYVARFEESGGALVRDIDQAGPPVYSLGGTLTTATAELVDNSVSIDLRVTGEAATNIAWEAYIERLDVTL